MVHSLRLPPGLPLFREANLDSSLFIRQHDDDIIYLLVHVDNIMLTMSDSALLQHMIVVLQSEFAMKDLGPLHHFLRITMERRS